MQIRLMQATRSGRSPRRRGAALRDAAACAAAALALLTACDRAAAREAVPTAFRDAISRAATPAGTMDRLRALAAQANADPSADAPPLPALPQMQVAFWTGEFDRLEREVAPLLARFEQTGSAAADQRLHDLVESLAEPPRAHAVAAQWAQRMPRSHLARAVYGHALLREGERARGEKAASETAAARFDEMHGWIERAAAELAAAAETSPRPMLALTGLLSAELYTGTRRSGEELADLGLRLSPHSYAPWWRQMTVLLPQWRGSLPAMQQWHARAQAAGVPDRLLRDLAARIDLAASAAERRANQRATPVVMQQIAARHDRPWLWKAAGDALQNAVQPDEALKAYTRAIDGARDDYPDARYWRAQLLMGAGRAAEALPDFERAARSGHAEAQAWLIQAFAYGNRGLPRDLDRLRGWCELAATHGNAWGEFCLGGLYFDGLAGYPREQGMALRYFALAADKGHAVAQHDYGWMLVQGRAVPADRDAGVAWLRKAAAQGSEVARDKLRSLGLNPERPAAETVVAGLQSRYLIGIALAVVAVFAALAHWLARRSIGPARAEGDARRLHFSRPVQALVASGLLLAVLAAWGVQFVPARQQWLAAAGALAIALAALASAYQVFLMRLTFDRHAIHYRSPLAGRISVPWSDVRRIGWSPLLQSHYIERHGGGRLWCSPWTSGAAELLDMIEVQRMVRTERARAEVPAAAMLRRS